LQFTGFCSKIPKLAFNQWGAGVIEHVSSAEELEVVMSSEVRDKPDLYLRHPRPPILRDYFNSRLRKVMHAHWQLRQITVKFEVEESFAPAI